MMRSLHSYRHPQLLPLTPFLLLHRLRNPLPHRLTNPLRPLSRPLPRHPRRRLPRILMQFLNFSRLTQNCSSR